MLTFVSSTKRTMMQPTQEPSGAEKFSSHFASSKQKPSILPHATEHQEPAYCMSHPMHSATLLSLTTHQRQWLAGILDWLPAANSNNEQYTLWSSSSWEIECYNEHKHEELTNTVNKQQWHEAAWGVGIPIFLPNDRNWHWWRIAVLD